MQSQAAKLRLTMICQPAKLTNRSRQEFSPAKQCPVYFLRLFVTNSGSPFLIMAANSS